MSTTFAPAVPTAERVERFYGLLCRFGADKMLDAALGTGRKALDLTKPMSAADTIQDEAGVDIEIGIDLGALFREAAKQGGIADLAAVVLDCDPADAPNAPVAAISEAIGPFAEASLGLIGTLMSFGSGSALTSTPPAG